VVDLGAEGFDCAVRVGDMPDSSMVSVRMADNRRLRVAAPSYLARHGTPQAPADLPRLDCLTLVQRRIPNPRLGVSQPPR